MRPIGIRKIVYPCIEDNRHRLHQGDSGHELSHPQRRPHTQLITDHERVKPPNRRPGQRGSEGGSLLSESRSSGRRLHKAAILKHIHPTCNSDSDAIQFSSERDKHASGKYATEVNHVFKINPNEFIEARVDRETVRKLYDR